MNKNDKQEIYLAREVALKILKHNSHGPCRGLPRTAGWGYPEPYTRDLMISALGILVSEDKQLINSLRKVLEKLAQNQSTLGHIPSLVHDPEDRGASDTTPLFLMAAGVFRKTTGETDFLHDAVDKALVWMKYQSPCDRVLVAQLPTSDWRDEQWITGYGLYVNTILYTALRLLGCNDRAARLKELMGRFTISGDRQHRHVHEGLVLHRKPYYALWSYKLYKSERFDLLGNSLAILSGIAAPSRTKHLVSWIETESTEMRKKKLLALQLPPNFFPFIEPEDPDWRERYKKFNQPGEYHNGGVWPFICSFYVAALVASERYTLAEKKLISLTEIVRVSRDTHPPFGFNEWLRAQDGTPQGEDWQTWSAAMYLYAATCVEKRSTPFFDEVREYKF